MYVVKESSEAAKGLATPKSPQFETNVLDSGRGQMNWGEPFSPPMAADCHRIYVVTCVMLNITIYHLLPKNIVQNTKLRVSDFLVVSNSVLLSNLRSKTDEKNGGS